MWWRSFVLLLLLTISSAASLPIRGGGTPVTLIYVSTTGSDSNSGTLASPYLTIGKAQTAAQTLLAANKCPGIVFRGGTYPVASTLNFGTSDSGTSSCTVTWSSYPGENAIWSGGTVLTGTFSLCTTADSVCNSGSGGVYQSSVTLTAFRELYVNGSHRTRARGSAGPSGWSITSSGYTSGTDMSAWGNPTNIEIVSASGAGSSQTTAAYQQTRCTIASMSGTAVTMATNCFNTFKNHSVAAFGASTTPWWIENAYELLPTCGQGCWYYNRTTNILYYIPENGENISTVPVVAPQLVDMISCNDISHITFSRLTFSYTTWNPDTGGNDYISEQNGYYCINNPADCSETNGILTTPMDGTITCYGGTNNVTFSHNLFTHIGSRSLFFEHGSQNVAVYANDFTDNGGGAIQWGDSTDATQTNPALQTSGLTFRDNQVDQPFEYQDSGGFFGMITTGLVVDHNEFTANPWAPLTVGTGWAALSTYSGNNSITNNLVTSACQIMFDCGSFYANGAQSSLSATGNYGVSSATLNGCIYPDAGSTNGTWTGNVCDPGTSKWLYMWTSTIQNNTVTGNWTTTSSLENNCTGCTVSGNTTYTSGSPPAGAAAVIASAGIESGVTPGP